MQNGGDKLRYEGIGDVAVLPDSMGHSVSSGNSRTKASILTDPDVKAILAIPGKGTRAVHYDFTVYRRADNGKCALYDLAVEDR